MPPAGVSYRVLLGMWWRRKWIRTVQVGAFFEVLAQGLKTSGTSLSIGRK